MTLSVIIVSYNVKFFLEQCLFSVSRAARWAETGSPTSLATEIVVVDNGSADGTVEYLRVKFPAVRFVANVTNAGFAAANNQALRLASGEYVLFLNPDTIVPEDCFANAIRFMRANSSAGAMGVRMVDGRGRFLRESKRGFPSPWVSFCKMSGLTATFPRSRNFAGYYLGHLDDRRSHSVDALAGAFMLCLKNALQAIGGFDERFFMYAEDIDLSYRIQKSGYSNYYCADITIIHFKGESTPKDRHHVRLFYNAMRQFVRKHYNKSAWALGPAIWFRGGLAVIERTFKRSARPVKPAQAGIHLEGDEDSRREVIEGFAPAAQPDPAANTVVYCEGEQLSFKTIIVLWQQDGRKKMIHAAGSGSIVGSSSRRGIGQVAVLRESEEHAVVKRFDR